MIFLLLVTGIGYQRGRTLEKMKQKHTHAFQVMEKLVIDSKEWKYNENKGGINPYLERNDSEQPPLNTPREDESSDGKSIGGDDHKQNKNGKEKEEASKQPPGNDELPDTPPPVDNEHSPTQDVTATTKESRDGKSKEEDGHQVNVYVKIWEDEQKGEESTKPVKATPLLVAAKNGITEIVKKILETFPVAIFDVDEDDKNIVLLAVENRQSHIYELMLKIETMDDSVFEKIDKNENSALHLTAMLSQKLPWSIPGVALQMQWEIKWYKYVMQSVGCVVSQTYNNKGQMAQEIFIESHKELVKDAVESISKTSQSFSVVAVLVASVAYASSATVPGGTDQTSGRPILFGEFPFQIFTVSVLVAFCFSVASLLMFLSIVSSPKPEDFERNLPVKLIVALTTLFIAIAAMLISFCAGNFLGIDKELKYVVFAIYTVTIFLVYLFAISLFPLYAYLYNATFNMVPKRSQMGLTF
ncbi:uncharacterized protein [Typha latifolia]|uniref:uncharacterized protein n=1 Tax=Typha latifolia TaxID=4733 RepID=UPI003C2FA711